jgi:putative Mg2+ transporter-C (MgtC) family protein
MNLQPIDLRAILDLFIAYLMAFPVGWERERHERSAGLRTFPLVSVASCAFVLISAKALHGVDAQSRVIQGLFTGVGFIGAGTIMKYGQTVHGTATAASILVTAVIGVCVAYHYYDIGVVLSVMALFTLRMFEAWKRVEPNVHKWDRES